MVVGDQRHIPVALSFCKHAVHILQEAEWVRGPVWTAVENLAPTEIRSPDHPARRESL